MIDAGATSYRGKRWVVASADAGVVERLSRELRVPGLVAGLLVNRGLVEAGVAAAFLEPKFKELHSPWLLPNMEEAAERIARAVREKQKITLYGDYDVDGITGTAMLWQLLKAAGAEVDYYIPHRVEEGYGVNEEAVKGIVERGAKLIVTVDCGCSGGGAVGSIRAAREAGVDVVVSDHHEFGVEMPAAIVVHPRLTGNSEFRIQNSEFPPYPNADLCGAGVAYKLAWAVAEKLSGSARVNEVYRGLLVEFTALVALGTIADVVPLVGENRILVKYGLGQLLRTKNEGLWALIHAAGYGVEGGRALDCTAVGFGLAPRLNAAGRMDHAREAVELLTMATGARAEEIAKSLEKQNRDRQAIERKMVALAREQIEARRAGVAEEDRVLVAVHESFHAGVVGIVASRLVDTYGRPAFVLARQNGELHGSARSIAGFELHLAIEHVRELLTSGGGHAMAGGVRMPQANLEAFQERLNGFAQDRLTAEQLMPSLEVDGELMLAECVVNVIGMMEKLEPFGRGNPRPRFVVRGVRISAPPRRVGVAGAHLQLTIAQSGNVARCIAFRMGDLEPQIPVGTEVDLVVEPKVDEYQGRKRVDLVVVDALIRQ